MNDIEPSADQPLTQEEINEVLARSAPPPEAGAKRRRRAFWWKLNVLLWMATAVAGLAFIAGICVPPGEGEEGLAEHLRRNADTAGVLALSLGACGVLSMIMFWCIHRAVNNARLEGQLKELTRTVVAMRKKPS